MADYQRERRFLQSNFDAPETQDFVSDQSRGLPCPPAEKPCPAGAEKVKLPAPDSSVLRTKGLYECLGNRRSRRRFTSDPLALAELSYLLWATQGVHESGEHYSIRTVPSAGARHPFETYVVVFRVAGLKEGVYRYQPFEHGLVYLFEAKGLREEIVAATLGQRFAGECAATFVWSCVPCRGEWRYGPTAHKPMLLDAGHICQNLYLACESIGCGTCAIAAYDQKLLDAALRLDGQDEFSVYLAPVGRI
jgi:SagB-type dehydrogenase family enzyme